MAVHPNNHLARLAIFFFHIGHVVQPMLAGNNVIVEASSARTSEAMSLRPAAINSVQEWLTKGSEYQERIVGGHDAQIGKWPWIAAIFLNKRHHCDGTLIDDKHILTAAHCTKRITAANMPSLTIHLGDHNIETDSEVRHVQRRVKNIVQHEDYGEKPYTNHDIAIITMDEPVQFTQSIKPIDLPSGSQLYVGKMATIIGWGDLADGGPAPAVLQEVSVPILSNSDCASKYGEADGFIPSVLCAGSAWKSSCSGDSGGPLMVRDAGRWIQVGIVSWGDICGEPRYPGVYTRVTQFMPWIRRNLR